MGERKEGFVRNIFTILKDYKVSFMVGFLLLLAIYTFLYGVWRIPFIDFGFNRMSEISILDYAFIFVITFLSALFIVLWRYERHIQNISYSAVGIYSVGFVGFVSAACPVCQSVGIIALGSTLLSIPTGFLTPYLGILKIFSIGLLGLTVFLKADSIYTKNCVFCTTKNVSNIKTAEVVK